MEGRDSLSEVIDGPWGCADTTAAAKMADASLIALAMGTTVAAAACLACCNATETSNALFFLFGLNSQLCRQAAAQLAVGLTNASVVKLISVLKCLGQCSSAAADDPD